MATFVTGRRMDEVKGQRRPEAKVFSTIRVYAMPVEKKVKVKLPTDKWGARCGSDAARVNAAVSHHPKTMKQLLTESGVKNTHYNHMKELIQRGFVQEEWIGGELYFSLTAPAVAVS